jgi:hypothetical protein
MEEDYGHIVGIGMDSWILVSLFFLFSTWVGGWLVPRLPSCLPSMHWQEAAARPQAAHRP